tara:strand:+ start:2354 stop:2497 length:144 start_codon:yes stop_codon:yes gene_type:complete
LIRHITTLYEKTKKIQTNKKLIPKSKKKNSPEGLELILKIRIKKKEQ